MDLSISYHLTNIQNKKMLFAASKYYFTTLFMNLLLLKAELISWGEFGIMGAVIGSLFALIYFLLKPIIKMMVEDKQSDNEIKVKLADNINQLQNTMIEFHSRMDVKMNELDKDMKDIKNQLNSGS